MTFPSPDDAFASFEREIDLLGTAERTGAPTRDLKSRFFGMPHDEFVKELKALRNEIESRAYLAIVAASEAVVQVDFRARATRRRSSVLLASKAYELIRRERQGRRVDFEDVLDAWTTAHGARRDPIQQFKQLLLHRHWLAHGQYFPSRSGIVSPDSNIAITRARSLLEELVRLDSSFPRGT